MAPKPLPPINYLRQRLCYNPQDGKMHWLPVTEEMRAPFCGKKRAKNMAAIMNSKYAGKEAGRVSETGYRVIFIDGQSFQASRIAWAIYHKREPSQSIDHINGIRSDNRILNLREVSASENSKNRGIGKNNKSGFVGVEITKTGRFRASMRIDGKLHVFGEFTCIQDAKAARREAEFKFGYIGSHRLSHRNAAANRS